MASKYFEQRIISNDKPLILTSDASLYISRNIKAAGYLLLSGAFPRNLRLAIKHLQLLSSHGAIIHDQDGAVLKELLAEELMLVKAAGGLVRNSKEEVLLIFRRGFWDMPKGKLDKDESMQECAEREVMEETGIKKLRVGGLLRTTYHIYEEQSQKILKHTEWYDMATDYDGKLKPQLEEDIFDVRWVAPSAIGMLMKQSHLLIKELVHDFVQP